MSVFAENICPFFWHRRILTHFFLSIEMQFIVCAKCGIRMQHDNVRVYLEKTNEFKRRAINKRNANDSIIESNELLNFYFFGSVGVFFRCIGDEVNIMQKNSFNIFCC